MAVRRIGDGSDYLDKNIVFNVTGMDDKTNYFISCWIKCNQHSITNNSVVSLGVRRTSTDAIQYGYTLYSTSYAENILQVGHDDFPPSGGAVNSTTLVKNQGWQLFTFFRFSADIEDPAVTSTRSIAKNNSMLATQQNPEIAEGTLISFELFGKFDTNCDYSFFDLRVYDRVLYSQTRNLFLPSKGKDGIITDDISSSGKTCNLLLRTCIANKATNGTDTGDLAQCNDHGPLKLTPDMSAVDANFQSEPDPWSPWIIGG